MPPKVSVNICCYNSEKFIKETIQSVLDQTFRDLELIIIDDGSKDSTSKIVRSFSDPRIKYYYQENRGLSASRNRAIELSQGEYIALLDHDDLWEEKKLEKQIALLDSRKNLGLVYSDSYFIDENGRITGSFFKLNKPAKGCVIKELIEGDFIPCLTAVMRRSYMQRVGNFRDNLKIAEEYDYFIRLSLISEFDYIDEPLSRYRIHSNNTSKDLIGMYNEEIWCISRISKLIKKPGINPLIIKRIQRIYFMIGMSNACKPYYKKWKTTTELMNMLSNIKSPFMKIILIFLNLLPSFINKIILRSAKIIRVILRT